MSASVSSEQQQPFVDDERADSELVASCSCLVHDSMRRCTKRNRWIWSLELVGTCAACVFVLLLALANCHAGCLHRRLHQFSILDEFFFVGFFLNRNSSSSATGRERPKQIILCSNSSGQADPLPGERSPQQLKPHHVRRHRSHHLGRSDQFRATGHTRDQIQVVHNHVKVLSQGIKL